MTRISSHEFNRPRGSFRQQSCRSRVAAPLPLRGVLRARDFSGLFDLARFRAAAVGEILPRGCACIEAARTDFALPMEREVPPCDASQGACRHHLRGNPSGEADEIVRSPETSTGKGQTGNFPEAVERRRGLRHSHDTSRDASLLDCREFRTVAHSIGVPETAPCLILPRCETCASHLPPRSPPRPPRLRVSFSPPLIRSPNPEIKNPPFRRLLRLRRPQTLRAPLRDLRASAFRYHQSQA